MAPSRGIARRSACGSEAGHVGLAAGPRVAEGLLPRLRRLPQGVERLRGAAAAVGLARREQALGVGAVDVEPLGLTVAGGGRPLVPVEAEPAQRLQQRPGVVLGRAREVGVLDPEHVDAAVVARQQPVEQRGAGAAHVQMAGRARSKANADRFGHRASIVLRPNAPPAAVRCYDRSHGRGAPEALSLHQGRGAGGLPDRPLLPAGGDPLPARAQRLPAHRARQGHLPRLRPRRGAGRPLPPALRRHQPHQGEPGVRRRHHARRPLARLRLGARISTTRATTSSSSTSGR